MTFDYQHARVGYAGASHKVVHKRADAACSSGGFYKSPTSGQSISSGANFNISWDTSCLTANAVDIYLYAPGAENTRLHIWQNVNYALGSYTTQLSSGWWNSSSSIQLQLSIVQSGTQPFLSPFAAAPIFTATVGSKDSSSGSVASSAITQNVNNFIHGLSGGKIAAAVILPLLVVGGLILAAWLKFNRAKTEEKRKRFSEVVDKRMSTISTDWKSMSAAGATAAIRHSMAVSGTSGNRTSSFSFGNIRPSSTVALEGGQAGIGTRGLYTHSNGSSEKPQMSQLRSGLNATGERVSRVSFATDTRISRVSFAADTRPSGESRRVASRAFHTGHAPMPPLPLRTDTGELSPTQTFGAVPLTPDDIRARMSGQEVESRPSIDDYIPALSMMRRGGEEGSGNNDLLFPAQESALPSPPPPARSPVGMMPMQPMPASVMSPDEMLRAYADSRRAAGTPASGGPTFPSPAMSYDGNGMRTLYSPPPTASEHNPSQHNPYKSMAISEYSRYTDDDAYTGTAN